MKARLFVTGVALAAFALPAAAQQVNSQCPGGAPGSNDLRTQDACQKAIDLFQFMAPQLGVAITGGNAQLGQGGTLGGLGHFSFGVRANVVNGALPQYDQYIPNFSGARADTFDVQKKAIPMPTFEAGFGVFKGLNLGITHVGSVDAIVSAAYVPEFSSDNIDLRVPDGSLKLGYGARVGILSGSPIWPAVSVTYLKRDLPTLELHTSVNTGTSAHDSITINDFKVKTTAWRVVASKGFPHFNLAAGAGQDTYDTGGQLDVQVSNITECPTGCSKQLTFGQKVTRTNYFADLGVNLFVMKLVGEVGMASGGDIKTYNQFRDRKADDNLLYGSVGLRVGF